MKDGQRNRVNRLGATAFFLAAKNTDVEVMKVLADAGADARIPAADGTTPLMVAAGLAMWSREKTAARCRARKTKCSRRSRCVSLGNDVNAANDGRNGAARRRVPRRESVVEFLVEQGARLDARDARLDAAGYRARAHVYRLL